VIAEEPVSEKLLLGFEEDEIRHIAKVVNTPDKGRSPGSDVVASLKEAEGGFDLTYLYVFGSRNRSGDCTWQVRSERSSQGKYALRLRGGSRLHSYICYQYDHMPYQDKEQPAAQVPYYRGMGGCLAYRALSTCSVFRTIFPTDWSGYNLFRFDVFCEGGGQTFHVVLEDEDIEPPVVWNVRVQPGDWTTVEVDLGVASSSRGLDLRRMATLYVILTEASPGGSKGAWVDNLRLCRKGIPAKLGTVRDDSPQELPVYYRSSKGPQPEKVPAVKPDRSPIALEKPFVIEGQELDEAATAQKTHWFVKAGTYYLAVTPCGWAAAYDNKHLLVGFTGYGRRNVYALQSLDGGKTWRGLDGRGRPTTVPVPNPDHGAGRGEAVSERADVLILTNLGCCGMGNAVMRLYVQKLTFTGKGWELRKDPALVDCDLRHCNSNQSIIRLSNGRLWSAYGLVGRLGTTGSNVRYSDDDGLVWKSWREGKSGALPGSFPSGLGAPAGTTTYRFEEPCIVPYGENGLACFWHGLSEGRYPNPTGVLRWSRFDGRIWSPIETVELGKIVPDETVRLRPPVHAVSLGGKEIFLVSSQFKGVLHYSGGSWTKECPQIPAGSRISVAGGKTVMVFAIVDNDKSIRMWERLPDGKWSDPVDLAKEEAPISMDRHQRPGLVVQAYAPPNFVPIAWTCKDKNWIKFLRVPVKE